MAIDFNKVKDVKVLGQKFNIIPDSIRVPLIDGALGTCNLAECEIQLAPGLSKGKREEVLLHEIVEAINHSLELQFEHDQITAISSALYQVLADNPRLVFGGAK